MKKKHLPKTSWKFAAFFFRQLYFVAQRYRVWTCWLSWLFTLFCVVETRASEEPPLKMRAGVELKRDAAFNYLCWWAVKSKCERWHLLQKSKVTLVCAPHLSTTCCAEPAVCASGERKIIRAEGKKKLRARWVRRARPHMLRLMLKIHSAV
jgi:hypothetical protein